ncbi:MAG: polymer-forming cytoskeletal protein [Kiloniellales bacterium]
MNSRPPIAPRAGDQPRRAGELPPALARRMQGPKSTMAQEEPSQRLHVPAAVTITGEIRDAQEVSIEGRVEADILGSRVLEISEAGSFVGNTEVEVADIQGRVEGSLTVTKQLLIRATGKVVGRVRYRDLYIEAGGRLAGQVDALEPGVDNDIPVIAPGDVEE